jgi:signal transduction histidine kinase/pSer/pThr/pTyr-binding forkhead associated (FHA) protein
LASFRIKIQRPGHPIVLGTLTETPRILGRSPDADFVLKEDCVSRRHAQFYHIGDAVYVEDLNSSNGVLVNGVRVQKQKLTPTDRIYVGSYTIQVEPVTAVLKTVVGNRTELDYDDVGALHDHLVDRDHSALSFLYRLSQRLAAQRSLLPLLEFLLDEMMENLPADRGFIQICEGIDGLKAQCVSCSRTTSQIAPPISQTLVEHVLATRGSVMTSDAGDDFRFDNSDSILAHQIKAAICVPLTSHDTVYGVIYADANVLPMPFTATHLQILSIVGQVAGAALENILLTEKQIHQERLAAIGQTVSATSHDMRNILMGISGGAEMLETANEHQNWERAAKATRLIRNSLRRFETLVESLLTCARKTDLSLEETNLGALVNEVVESIEPEAEKRRVRIRVENRLRDKIMVDGQQIHRVLLNLMSNAMDAMPEGGNLTVEVAAEEDANVVRVRDTGAGITPEDLSRVGQAFFTTKKDKGTGLGLAVCNRIMEQHGGRLHLESVLGEGTTVSLVFPDLGKATARIKRMTA